MSPFVLSYNYYRCSVKWYYIPSMYIEEERRMTSAERFLLASGGGGGGEIEFLPQTGFDRQDE